MDSNKEDKVPTSTPTNDNHHVPMDIDMSACEDDCMGDDSDSEMDMETLMATINKRDPMLGLKSLSLRIRHCIEHWIQNHLMNHPLMWMSRNWIPSMSTRR